MGRRIGLARVENLLENLKREINLAGSTLTSATITGQSNAITAAHGAGAISTEVAPAHYRYTAPDGSLVNTIDLDLTGLKSYNDEGDVIGLDGVAGAYVTKYVASTFGVLYKVEMSCLELPTASSNVALDFDLISATSATLAGDGAVDGESDAVDVFIGGGNAVLGTTIQDLSAGQPDADGDAIYLVTGATHSGASVFTAGKLLIKFYGHPTF